MSRENDTWVTQKLPSPIATAWQRVRAARTDHHGLADHLVSAYRVLMRTLLAFQLSDCLRGPWSEDLEPHLEPLTRASDGIYLSAVRELTRHLAARTELPPFMPEAAPWLFRRQGRRRKTKAHLALDAFVAGRNQWEHSLQSRQKASELLATLGAVFGSLRWLEAYRLFRVLSRKTTRRGTGGPVRGTVQFLVGSLPPDLIEPRSVSWPRDAGLEEGGVYLASPRGDRCLDMFPFLLGPDDLEHARDGCAVVHAVPDWTRIVLLEDGSQREHEVPLPLGGETGARVLSELAGDPGRAAELGEHAFSFGATARVDPSVFCGRYRVLDALGAGAMAEVLRVEDTLDGRELALKILRRDVAEDEVVRLRFLREARTLQELRHPNVVRVLDLSADDASVPFFTMPVYPGGSVEAALDAGRVPEERALAWGLDVLRALAHLHASGIRHRDVKPSNILLDAEERAVLADFGVALDLRHADHRLTASRDQPGTWRYMSPEQLGRIAAPVTEATDIFSLAVVLDELLTGEIHGDAPGEVLEGAVGELVRGMARRLPERRPTAEAALGELLRILGQPQREPPWGDGRTRWSGGGDPRAAEPAAGVEAVDLLRETLFRPALVHLRWPGDGHGEAAAFEELLVAATPVTQEQFAAVMDSNPAWFQSPDAEHRRRPVENVSWYHAVRYCNALSKAEQLRPAYEPTGRDLEVVVAAGAEGYRLPTEEEWRLLAGLEPGAAPAPDAGQLLAGAWLRENAGGTTHAVASRQRSPHGIWDALGNVMEWCHDAAHDASSARAGAAASEGVERMRAVRGGCFDDPAGDAERWLRREHPPGHRERRIGFRVVRPVPRPGG